MQELKRKLTASLLWLPMASLLSACMGQGPKQSEAQRRFNGMGLALVVDAVEGVEMLGVEFFADGNEDHFYASSVTRKGNREIMSFPSRVVPELVRVVWKKTSGPNPDWWAHTPSSDDYGRTIKDYHPPMYDENKPTDWGKVRQQNIERRKLIAKNIGFLHEGPWGAEYAGAAVGDYTFPVASRIPDEVVKEIRKNGGGLRLKFRLKPDGVLFGWDIERFSGGSTEHGMPGGDFLATRY